MSEFLFETQTLERRSPRVLGQGVVGRAGVIIIPPVRRAAIEVADTFTDLLLDFDNPNRPRGYHLASAAIRATPQAEPQTRLTDLPEWSPASLYLHDWS